MILGGDESKIKRRLIIIILASAFVFVACLVWLFIIWRNDNLQPAPSETTNTVYVRDVATDFSIPPPSEEETDEWVVEPNLPRYMSVPNLNITRARIESLGLKANTNQIDDPHHIWDAAWYDKSAGPGVDGIGVYSCHTFFAPGGLCDGFGDLPLGTEIKIERGDGVVFTYKIVENFTMAKEIANSYMSTLFELPNIANIKQGISLVTCAGDYDIYSGVASHRTMVRAILK